MYDIKQIVQQIMRHVGLVGSLFMFSVYSQSSLSNVSISIYFRCMAIVCFCSTIMAIFNFYFNKETYETCPHLASLSLFLSELLAPLSAWLEVFASFDRFLTIVFPFKFKFIQKTSTQIVLITTVVILNILLNIYSLIGIRYIYIITGIPDNYRGRIKIGKLLYVIDLVNSSLIPFVTMLLLSVATLAGVLRAHQRIKSSVLIANRKLVRDIKFGITMLVLNALFFIFIGLYRLRKLYEINPFNRKSNIFAFYFFDYALVDLSDDYYFLNFYIQLAVNSVVREEVVKIIVRIAKKIKKFFSASDWRLN